MDLEEILETQQFISEIRQQTKRAEVLFSQTQTLEDFIIEFASLYYGKAIKELIDRKHPHNMDWCESKEAFHRYYGDLHFHFYLDHVAIDVPHSLVYFNIKDNKKKEEIKNRISRGY